MLPLRNSYSMLMPGNACMTGVPHMMVPMMSVQPAPVLCMPNNLNMCLSTTMTNENDSRTYGRFRHVERDQPSYRHAPFDWYRPPQQRYDVVHEDAAVITLDGAMPLGNFYRDYIYGEDVDYGDSSSYTTEEYDDRQESSYEPRNTSYRRESDFNDDDDEGTSNQRPIRTNHYSTLDPNRRSTIPSSSNTPRNQPTTRDNDFDDRASINSTYGN